MRGFSTACAIAPKGNAATARVKQVCKNRIFNLMAVNKFFKFLSLWVLEFLSLCVFEFYKLKNLKIKKLKN